MSEPKPKREVFGLTYKARPKLEPSEQLFDQMRVLGTWNVTQGEAAAALGCSRDTLLLFWKAHPQYREAFDIGQSQRKIRIRRNLDAHALVDPATARFQAKNELGMSDDPSKAKADEAQAKTLARNMKRDELDSRLKEMHGKLVDITPRKANGAERGGPARLLPPAGQAAHVGPDHAGGPAPAKEPPRQARPAVPAGSDAGAGAVSLLARVQARLAELEATAVRKNPRKDGQPHTNRHMSTGSPFVNTSPEHVHGVDASANKPQIDDRAPARLPGRIEPRKR